MGALGPHPVPSSLYQMYSPPINSQCTNFVLFDVALQLPLESKGLSIYITHMQWVSHNVHLHTVKIFYND